MSFLAPVLYARIALARAKEGRAVCRCCLSLQAARGRAEGRLYRKMREHGSGIPGDHLGMAFLKAEREINEARKECFHRHHRDTAYPTCIVSGELATVFDPTCSAMVCAAHARPQGWPASPRPGS